MEKSDEAPKNEGAYDIGQIRPPLNEEAVKLRDRPQGGAAGRMRKALTAFHTLELMAVNIYKYQVSGKHSELDRQLIAAMVNEMTHLQDFQQKLFEYGWRPSPIRWAYWLVGFFMGRFSRIMGREASLRTGIWVETKAVHHYGQLLGDVDWDEDTRSMIEKNQADEYGHINRWKEMLERETAAR